MNKALICLAIMLTAVGSWISAAGAAERVKSFDARMVLRDDGSAVIQETIRIDSDGGTHEQSYTHNRGIWRSFYIREQGRFAMEHLMELRVLDLQIDGETAVWTEQRHKFDVTVMLGPKVLVLTPGEHVFVLTYAMDRLIKFMPDHDRLFWWVFGKSAAGWAESIGPISLTVELPGNATGRMRELHGYTEVAAGNVLQHIYQIRPGKEYFLVNLELPKGVIRPPDLTMQLQYFLRDMTTYLPGLIGMMFFLLYYLMVWSKVGRDPARGVIVPRYTPPADMSPAVMRCLLKMGYDHKAFAAALVSLIAKKAVTLSSDDDEYVLHRNDPYATVFPDEEVLANALCSLQQRSVKLNALNLFSAFRAHRRYLRKSLRRTYYVRNVLYFIPGLLIMVTVAALNSDIVGTGKEFKALLWILGGWAVSSFMLSRILFRKRVFDPKRPARLMYAIVVSPLLIYAAGALLSGFTEAVNVRMTMFTVPLLIMISVAALFYHLLKAPTALGRERLDEIEGFMMFLGKAEKSRLAAMYPPDQLPAAVEAIFPYAVALDEETWWAEHFSLELRADLTVPFVGIITGFFSRKKE